ncbi:MAG: sialyltransferase [Bacteroidetes bacterium]|jgi:hypothetical protein|nr:sialyltransferase [Bacteroidota bacterium]
MQTFSEFKENFYSRVKDFSLFDCQDFNILKVVLDGLKVNYAARGRYKTYMFYNELSYILYLRLKRILGKGEKTHFGRLKEFSDRKYLIIDPGRLKKNENGNFVSSYFCNFYSRLNNYTSISDTTDHPELVNFVSADLFNELQFEPLSSDERLLRKDLLKTFKNIEHSGIFNPDELLNIKISIDLCFRKYREWTRILKVLRPQQAFFVCHYHKEGAILAMKRIGIKMTELQHGLIAPEDIFYMFPSEIKPVRGKALFADEIWVYGEFWRQRLLQGAEYEAGQIKVFGYYLHENNLIPELTASRLKDMKGESRVILITTQDKHPQEIIDYISFLSKDILEKKYNYRIWVKPHPAEKKGTFNQIAQMKNVVVLEENLDYLFKYSDMMISIYSTTLYDACRYNLPAFALYISSCADYVNSIVDSGVAKLIYPDQNPIEINETSGKPLDSGFYFSNCDYSMISV